MSGTTTANATKHIIGWVEPLEATRLPSPCGSPLTRRSELSLAVGTACCSLVGNSPLVRSSMFACTARRSRRSGRPGLINDTGYPVYFAATSIRTGDKAKLSPCLAKLVPILQQSQVDFIKNPEPAIDVIVDLVDQYKTGWVYSRGLAEYSAKAMKDLRIVGNGRDATLGDFELERVRRVIEIVTPIFTRQRKPVKPGLKPEDIATNEFIDPEIRLL